MYYIWWHTRYQTQYHTRYHTWYHTRYYTWCHNRYYSLYHTRYYTLYHTRYYKGYYTIHFTRFHTWYHTRYYKWCHTRYYTLYLIWYYAWYYTRYCAWCHTFYHTGYRTRCHTWYHMQGLPQIWLFTRCTLGESGFYFANYMLCFSNHNKHMRSTYFWRNSASVSCGEGTWPPVTGAPMYLTWFVPFSLSLVAVASSPSVSESVPLLWFVHLQYKV